LTWQAQLTAAKGGEGDEGWAGWLLREGGTIGLTLTFHLLP